MSSDRKDWRLPKPSPELQGCKQCQKLTAKRLAELIYEVDSQVHVPPIGITRRDAAHMAGYIMGRLRA